MGFLGPCGGGNDPVVQGAHTHTPLRFDVLHLKMRPLPAFDTPKGIIHFQCKDWNESYLYLHKGII